MVYFNCYNYGLFFMYNSKCFFGITGLNLQDYDYSVPLLFYPNPQWFFQRIRPALKHNEQSLPLLTILLFFLQVQVLSSL
jgi:hypothetical protein